MTLFEIKSFNDIYKILQQENVAIGSYRLSRKGNNQISMEIAV